MSKVRIGRRQVMTILAILVFGKAVGFSSGIMARSVGNDAWIAMLLAFGMGLPTVAVVVWLAGRFGTEGPATYIPRLLGRWLGSVVLGLMALFFYGAYITAAITLEGHIWDFLMPETPVIVFIVLFTVLCLYCVYLGIEVTARLALWGLLGFVALDVMAVAGTLRHADFSRLLPILDHAPGNVVQASMVAATDVAAAIATALVLLPMTGRPRGWLRVCWWGLAVGGVLTVIWPIFELAVLGPELTAQYLIACMQLGRAAELGIYLHRYELLMVIAFAYGMIVQAVVPLYCACRLTAAALPGTMRRTTLIAVCAALTLAPHYYLTADRERYATFLARWWPAFAVPVAFGVPLLLGVVVLFRSRVRGAGAAAVSRPR